MCLTFTQDNSVTVKCNHCTKTISLTGRSQFMAEWRSQVLGTLICRCDYFATTELKGEFNDVV